MKRLDHLSLMREQQVMNSDTLSYVDLWVKYDPKHESEIWFEPSLQDDLSFSRKPPPLIGQAEEKFQQWFEKSLIPQTHKHSWVKVVGTKNQPLLEGKKPDISTHPSSVRLSAHTVDRIGEIKKPDGPDKEHLKDFQGAHKGQTAYYGMVILRIQRLRNDVTVFLTDCYSVTFFRVRWSASVGFSVQESMRYPLTGQDSLGRRLLSAVLKSRHPTIPFSPLASPILGQQLIAETQSSTIFAASLPDCVLKLCVDPALVVAEVAALRGITRKLGEHAMIDLGIVRLDVHNTHAMCIKPRAKGPASVLILARKLPRSCLAPIVSALEAVHRAGFLHRDTRASNILLLDQADGTVKPVLADFGCSCTVAAAMPITAAGGAAASYWSRHAAEGRPFRPEDDLHIFARALYGIRNEMPDRTQVAQCLEFWDNIGEPWSTLFQLCEDKNYAALQQAVAALD
eukprot:m.189051 g.189051  ORF g.189051 m.189051 type:complete len:455 (+) comp10032_c1_seq26:1410-2774(+)